MGTAIKTKQPFHLHLEQCEQCRRDAMNLCEKGNELLSNRSYETYESAETAYCYVCQKTLPKKQIETRQLTNKDGYKSGVARCATCWKMRDK